MFFLHICWALLNIALLIGLFIFLGVQSKRYGALKVGMSLLILVTICQAVTRRSANQSKIAWLQTTVLMPGVAVTKFPSHYIILEDLTLFKLNQVISLLRKNQSDSVQVNSSVYTTGFVAGIHWSSSSTSIKFMPDQRVQYRSAGFLEWQLLGLTMYKQPKQFDGSVKAY